MRDTYGGYNAHNENKISTSVEIVEQCPICKKATKPIHLNSVYTIDRDSMNTRYFFDSHLYCTACNNSFIAGYLLDSNKTYSRLLFVAPQTPSKHNFSEKIEELFPDFIKIYNQSLTAESQNLDEIAGIGYRKSLEFLIKDFTIRENANDEEKIKKMPLMSCIKDYIDNSKLKSVAEKSAWLGNDETHYVRKFEDRDITDMKSFIEATVYFINMILITEDAESMSPK